MRFVKGPFKGLTTFLDPVPRLTLVALLVHVPNALAEDTARCDKPIATITSVQGTVEVRRGDHDTWQAAQLNQALCGGVEIRTQALSRAQILLRQGDAEGPNETHFQIDEHSALALPKSAETSWLDLLRGAVLFFSRTPATLTIKTLFANAKVEGTEFLVRVDPAQTSVSVFEGKVLVSNALGSVRLVNGEAAVAEANRAPRREILLKPRDAVQWALYYPPLIDTRLAPTGPNTEALREALRLYQSGQIMQAVGHLDKVDAKQRDSAYHDLRAGLLLSVGRVELARGDIAAARKLKPQDGTALALESIIAVTQNDKTEALRLTQQAIIAEPNSPIPHVARSYAEQASFKLDEALVSARAATRLAPDNALAWARVAELELAQGDMDEAEEAAEKSRTLDPRLARTQTIAGFAALTRIEISKATTAFTEAIARDPADPLPRLGLGLAKIRRGQLEDGRRDIEVAANLDPNNALVRSYLGKAYYEEKRSTVAGIELDNAKALDPKDPTPWFYDAIRKQTENRPVEALHDLQKSIEINDNRAVYRSKLQLDQDLAARAATIGRIYNELDFRQLGLLHGWTSTTIDPLDYSAHRLLADSYSTLPRHEIARTSELLQSQLLQPLNITPVQPQLAENDLFLLGGQGPTQLSLNEFNPSFLRNRFSWLASGLVGSNNTYADEVVHSGLWNRLSYSLGQFHYSTDGFRPNSDIDTNIFNAFTQFGLGPNSSAQLEFRHQETDSGDLRDLLDPSFIFETLRRRQDRDTIRFGASMATSPSGMLIGSVAYRNNQFTSTLPALHRFSERYFPMVDMAVSPGFSSIIAPAFPLGLNTNKLSQIDRDDVNMELQYQHRLSHLHLILGGGYAQQERLATVRTTASLTSSSIPAIRQNLTALLGDPVFAKVLTDLIEPNLKGSDTVDRFRAKDGNAYVYSILKATDTLSLTVGAGLHVFSIDTDSPKNAKRSPINESSSYITPKFGAVWQPFQATTVRAAWFRAVSRILASGQTIEPTHLAGFNQHYDEPEGTRSENYGFAIDQALPWSINAGYQVTWRDLVVPQFLTGVGKKIVNATEELHRVYLYWTPVDRLALSAEYKFERFERTPRDFLSQGIPLKLDIHQVPLSLKYFNPNGFFSSLSATYVNQDGIIRGAQQLDSQKADSFWVLDLAVGYRLPKRFGILSFGIRNLLDESFFYQEPDFILSGDADARILPPSFFPERAFFGQLTLAF